MFTLIKLPLLRPHIFTALSKLPDAEYFPSVEHATVQIAQLCTLNAVINFPCFTDHIFNVPIF